MYTYEDICKFAESQHLTQRPFNEVLQLYDKEVADIMEDAYADEMTDYYKSYPDIDWKI